MGVQSQKIALGGLLAALAVAIMLLGGVIPIATFCAPLLAMAVLLPVLEEYGTRAAATAYGAVAILSLMLVTDRETALVYLFFGWYPILRPRIAALPSRIVRLLCRLVACNAAVFLLYGLVMSLLGLGSVTEGLGGGWFKALLLIMANITFLLLDRALGRLTVLWRRKLRRRFLS